MVRICDDQDDRYLVVMMLFVVRFSDGISDLTSSTTGSLTMLTPSSVLATLRASRRTFHHHHHHRRRHRQDHDHDYMKMIIIITTKATLPSLPAVKRCCLTRQEPSSTGVSKCTPLTF